MTEKLIGVIGKSLAFSTTRSAIATAREKTNADHRRAGFRLADEVPRKQLTAIADNTAIARRIAVPIVVMASCMSARGRLPHATRR
jgi:hypothetical protein